MVIPSIRFALKYQFNVGIATRTALCAPYFMAYYVALICILRLFISRDAAMPARRKTVPVTTGVRSPDFSIRNWARVEAACKFKSKLEASHADINAATRRFVWLGRMEAKAISSDKKQDELFEISEDAKRLRLKLEPLKKAVSVQTAETIKIDFDSSFQTIHRLGQQFEGTHTFRSIGLDGRKRFPDFVEEMKYLYEILDSLETAAKKAGKAMKLEDGGQRQGDAWNRWIAELYTIMTDAGISATTSNDSGKRAHTETPFERFVKELQKQLPEELRRPEKGLAKAIQRATKNCRILHRRNISDQAA